MASPAEEVEEIRERNVREQLVQEVEKCRREGNDRLASIISESLEE